MKRATFAFAALMLGGCFLQQHKPNPPVQPTNSAIEGVMAIEDISGPQTGALFMAMFARKSSGTAVARAFRVSGRPEQSRCRLQRQAKAAAAALLSVGKLSFGTALQSSFITVEENENHQYVKSLAAGFPAGIYQVAAAGQTDIPAFQDILQVPESLHDVRVNGQAFGSASVLVRKSEPLVATWREPAIPNADHIVIMDVETQTATERLKLHCIGLESSFTASEGSLRWTVPVDQLVGLPETKEAFIYFVRAIVKETKSATISLQSQGLRTVYTAAELGG